MSPLASRIREGRVLEGKRGVLYEAIQDQPGIHFRELSRKTGIQKGTMGHHLLVLEHLDYISSIQSGNYRRYIPRTEEPGDYSEAACYAREPQIKGLLEAVEERPGIVQRELLEREDRPRSTTQHYLSRCVELGLLDVQQSGRCKRYYPGSPRDPFFSTLLTRRAEARAAPRLSQAPPSRSEGRWPRCELKTGTKAASGFSSKRVVEAAWPGPAREVLGLGSWCCTRTGSCSGGPGRPRRVLYGGPHRSPGGCANTSDLGGVPGAASLGCAGAGPHRLRSAPSISSGPCRSRVGCGGV